MSSIPINQLLNYINDARTNPKKFSTYIKKQMDTFINESSLPLIPNCTYSTNEGKSAWREAYECMKNLKPLPPYQLNDGLNFAAMDHAIDMKNNNFFDHASSNGMSFSQRIQRRCGIAYGGCAQNLGCEFDLAGRNHALQTILGLIIDDGVSNRGHRKNLLSSDYRYCGIYAIKAGDRLNTCIDFHSQNLKVTNSSKQPLTASTRSSKETKLGKDNFDFEKQFENMKMGLNSGERKKPSSFTVTNNGEKTVKSKSTNTSTVTKNGKTTKIVTTKIEYSDGSTQEQVKEEHY